MIKTYYQLTKPGLIYGNLVTTTAGFLLAARQNFNFGLFLATIFGISFVMAAGCVFNNIFDIEIDGSMDRTRNRALVKGIIPKLSAIIFGTIFLILGILILFFYTNFLATAIAFLGFVVYVFLYTPIKKRSQYGTLVGSVAGAVPPIVGYCSVTGRFDLGALILFFILVAWQIPHFYSIAIYRFDDYKKASIPVLPVAKGIKATKINIIIYIILFTFAVVSLTLFKYTGLIYLVIGCVLGISWFTLAICGFQTNDVRVWARKMFIFSLIVLTTLSLTISISSLFKSRL